MNPTLRIVIADDHPIFRRGLVDVLATDPALQLVGQAANGQEALDLIATTRPDIAILDVHMPQLTGLETARRLRDSDSATRLILLTMYEDESLLHEALDLGIQGYVLKENAAEDLILAIRAVATGKTFITASMTAALVRRRTESEALRRDRPGLKRLTPTEQRVLRLIAEDRTSKEIAQLLGCAVRTVETHRQNMSTKLGLSGSHSLLKFAYENRASL